MPSRRAGEGRRQGRLGNTAGMAGDVSRAGARLCVPKSGAGPGLRAFALLHHLGRSMGSSRVFGLKVGDLTRNLLQELTPNSS